LEFAGASQTKLHDFHSIGLVTLDAQGTVLDVNRTGALLLAQQKRSLHQRRFADLVAREDIPKFNAWLRCCVRSRQRVSGELSLLGSDGRPVMVRFDGVPVVDRELRVLRLETVLIDISDRKRTEKALRESEAQLQAIMDNTPAMIVIKDVQGRYLHFNRLFEQVFHLSLKQTLGKTDAEIFPAKQAAAFRANDLKVLEEGIPLLFDEIALHADGSHTSIVTKFPLHDESGNIQAIASIVTDTTERRRLEAEVLRISEREQQRIAQDLHDGLGQHLTGIVHMAAVLQAKLAERSLPEATEAARIAKLLDDAVAQTRTLAKGLHPVPLEARGLMSSLAQLAAMVRELFKVDCRFDCPQPVALHDNVMATHLYRIAQEAINNAIKHGRASQIRIVLGHMPERITLTVQNNGAPIPKKRSTKEGLGLRIMQYRAEMIGGSLEIESNARRGTSVACTVHNHAAFLATAPVP
jgi:PAS domain S-box-containing protein